MGLTKAERDHMGLTKVQGDNMSSIYMVKMDGEVRVTCAGLLTLEIIS